MKAMILGAGRIGRGFVSELLHANQVEITYFDASSVMVDKLNEKKEYTIHVLGAEELNTHMEGVQAHLLYDIDALCKMCIRDSCRACEVIVKKTQKKEG